MPQPLVELTDVQRKLSDLAWAVRERSVIYGATKVGCAIATGGGEIFSGCNVEHRYRSHDVHAEINAITTMVSEGCTTLREIWIAAEREHFTPCGACLDWIIQFGGLDVAVVIQNGPAAQATRYVAGELMPYYPT